ncbi:c6 zink-finger pro1a [Trichoderma arundinaceum]|uniref:C6 zink-finger pro1a n=1 Tax=Trichoderma arundinaceum TaxID=490622 RepID=A0A395NQ36_TRIAR|nr:c6 zink-finger pro1a [Trichoderma arundinaceum]
MTQEIKAQVKQGATARRGNDVAVQVFSLRNDQQTERSPTAYEISPANSGTTQTSVDSAATAYESIPEETENFLITLYLDTVFPLLFPLYEPTILSGGRSWLPALLKANKAVFHSALSISAYYFTLLLAKDASHTLRTPCEQHVWDTLAKHMDESIYAIKQDMDHHHAESNGSNIFSKLQVLTGVVQYLIFASIMPQAADWKIHLSAALTLLEDIFQSYGVKDGVYSFESVLQAMDKPSIFNGLNLGFFVWNNDQAAFRFFTSFLLYADTMASIQLGRPSQLPKQYYNMTASLEESIVSNGLSQHMLETETHIGCHGWVLTILGEISTLEIAKRSAQHEGGYCPTELIRGSHELMGRLQLGMAKIDASVQSELLTTQQSVTRPFEQQDKSQSKKLSLVTKIWLHAAIIYLSVVVDGWQLCNPRIRDNANSLLTILDILPQQLLVRSIMWPLCIFGFVALPEQEHTYRNILSALGPLQALGPASQAFRNMERVWHARDRSNKDTWGIYDCFQILGSEILFI